MDDVATNLSENLRQLRETRGLSQQQLARLAGVPRPTWASLESEAVMISTDLVRLLLLVVVNISIISAAAWLLARALRSRPAIGHVIGVLALVGIALVPLWQLLPSEWRLKLPYFAGASPTEKTSRPFHEGPSDEWIVRWLEATEGLRATEGITTNKAGPRRSEATTVGFDFQPHTALRNNLRRVVLRMIGHA